MSNVDTIKGVYAALAAGDVPAVLGAFAPDITWVEAAGFPYGGTYTGADAVLENVLAKLASEWNGFSAVPRELVAEGDTVVALGDYGGAYEATGRSIDVPFAHVWKLRDGKAVFFQQFTDTALVREATG